MHGQSDTERVMDERLTANAIAEAQQKTHMCQPGEVVYLVSTSGYLRLLRTHDGQLYVVGASNPWLTQIAGKIAASIRATVR